jgi:hypothetical protein
MEPLGLKKPSEDLQKANKKERRKKAAQKASK